MPHAMEISTPECKPNQYISQTILKQSNTKGFSISKLLDCNGRAVGQIILCEHVVHELQSLCRGYPYIGILIKQLNRHKKFVSFHYFCNKFSCDTINLIFNLLLLLYYDYCNNNSDNINNTTYSNYFLLLALLSCFFFPLPEG